MQFARPWKFERALGVAIVALTGLMQAELNAGESFTTIYINQHFEVREHDAPTKYVWNGNTRVARVTGSLSHNQRVQRLRVYAGWNLVSLAVTATNALRQLISFSSAGGEGQGAVALIVSAFKWNPNALAWDAIVQNEAISTDTLLWIKASANATLTVTGVHSDPTNRTATAGGDFLPSAGLESWNLRSALSNQPSATVWTYNASFSQWVATLPALSASIPGHPNFVRPGEAVFVRTDFRAELKMPALALRLQYYHQDHIGSTTSLSDSRGEIVEEAACYPFGFPRAQFSLRTTPEKYQFIQKEQDIETGLHYFENRFFSARLARFTKVDHFGALPAGASPADPQRRNAYAYSMNNPLTFLDSDGDSAKSAVQSFEGVGYDHKNFTKSTGMLEHDGTIRGGKLVCSTFLAAAVADFLEVSPPERVSKRAGRKNSEAKRAWRAWADAQYSSAQLIRWVERVGGELGLDKSEIRARQLKSALGTFGHDSAVIVSMKISGKEWHVGLAYWDQERKSWMIAHADPYADPKESGSAAHRKHGKVHSQTIDEFLKARTSRRGAKTTYDLQEILPTDSVN